MSSTRTAVRRALRSVISGQRIDFEYRRALSMENGKHDWICMKLIPESSGNHLSGTYLSAALEERHPGSFAFEFEDAVVEFLPADQVQKESMDSLTSVLEKLGAICGVYLLIYQSLRWKSCLVSGFCGVAEWTFSGR